MNKHKVVLFMKGNPSAPKCGFSRQTVGLLREKGVEFAWFDILSDEDVRQGLKKVNDWPSESSSAVRNLAITDIPPQHSRRSSSTANSSVDWTSSRRCSSLASLTRSGMETPSRAETAPCGFHIPIEQCISVTLEHPPMLDMGNLSCKVLRDMPTDG